MHSDVVSNTMTDEEMIDAYSVSENRRLDNRLGRLGVGSVC